MDVSERKQLGWREFLATDFPKTNTPRDMAYEAYCMGWQVGAETEAKLMVEDMTESGREIYDFVHVLALKGESRTHIVDYVTRVFRPTLSTRVMRALRRLIRDVRESLIDLWQATEPLLPALGVAIVAGILVGVGVLIGVQL